MIRIERLLEVAPTTEQPQELQKADPRLEEATTAAMRGDYLRAAQVAEEIYDTGIFDVRLLGYLLYAGLLDRGPGSLGLILRATLSVASNWRQVLTPQTRRELLLDASLHWFLSNVVRQLDLSERLQSDGRKEWEQAVAQGSCEDVVPLVDQLLPVLTGLAARPRSPAPLLRLRDVIRQLRTQLAAERSPQIPSPGPALPKALVESQERLSTSPQIPVAEQSVPSVDSAPSNIEAHEPARSLDAQDSPVSGVMVEGSPALHQLLQQMQLFGALVAQQEHFSAAVVAFDIQKALAHFDPSVYLPTLVAPYLRTLAQCIDQIEPIFSQRKSLRFKTLAQLYRANPEGFAESQKKRVHVHDEQRAEYFVRDNSSDDNSDDE